MGNHFDYIYFNITCVEFKFVMNVSWVMNRTFTAPELKYSKFSVTQKICTAVLSTEKSNQLTCFYTLNTLTDKYLSLHSAPCSTLMD